MPERRPSSNKAWIALVGGIMVNFAGGMFWAYVPLADYFTAYFKIREPSSDRQNIMLALPVWAIAQLAFTWVGLCIIKSQGYRLSISSAMGFFSLVHFVLAFTYSPDFFVMVYGTFCGGCTGIWGLLSLQLMWSYYPTRLSSVTTIAVISQLLGAITFSYLGEKMMNPNLKDDYDSNEDDLTRFRDFFQILSAIFAVFTLLIAISLPASPSFTVRMPDNQNEWEVNSESWDEHGKEKMLREFGTIVDGRAKILNQNVAEMKVSGLDDLFASPLKPSQRPHGTRSLVFGVEPIQVSPLLVTKVPTESEEDKFCRSATIPQKQFLRNTEPNLENTVPLIPRSKNLRKSRIPPRNVRGMLIFSNFWMVALAVLFQSLFGFFTVLNWPSYFSTKIKLTVEEKSIIWRMGLGVSAVYLIVMACIIGKSTWKWVITITVVIGVAGGVTMDQFLDSYELSGVFLSMACVLAASSWVLTPALALYIFGNMSYRQAYTLLHSVLLISLTGAAVATRAPESVWPALEIGFAAVSVLALPLSLCILSAD